MPRYRRRKRGSRGRAKKRDPRAVEAASRVPGFRLRAWWGGYNAGERGEPVSRCPFRGDPLWSSSRQAEAQGDRMAWEAGRRVALEIAAEEGGAA